MIILMTVALRKTTSKAMMMKIVLHAVLRGSVLSVQDWAPAGGAVSQSKAQTDLLHYKLIPQANPTERPGVE